jgi:hypothetical protein
MDKSFLDESRHDYKQSLRPDLLGSDRDRELYREYATLEALISLAESAQRIAVASEKIAGALESLDTAGSLEESARTWGGG